MLGDNIRRLRAERGLTQKEVAKLADVNCRYYQCIEAREKSPTIRIASRIRKTLRCSWNELLQGM